MVGVAGWHGVERKLLFGDGRIKKKKEAFSKREKSREGKTGFLDVVIRRVWE